MKKTFQSANSRLARRLSMTVILASTLIAIITSGIQIYSEFQRGVKGVHADLEQIEQTHLSNISSRIWVLDVKELETTLNNLLSLPSIEYIAAYDNETLFMTVGTDTDHNVIAKNLPLHYKHDNKNLQIGKLIVKASLDEAYQHVIDQAIIIIATNTIKTFIVAGLILLIFYRLVTRHLHQIARFAEQLNIDTLEKTFAYDRKKNPPGNQDELDILNTALSNMQRNLAQATQHLQKREQDLAITLNSIGDAVIATDAEGNITRMNPVAIQLTGWSLEEASGQPLSTIFVIIDASTREPIENPVEKVITTGKVIYLSNHTTLIARDGSEYQIADSAAPIRDEDDNIQGMVLVFNDITERYQLREAAAKSRRDLQAIMDHSPTVIYVKDKEGRFTFSNQQFEKLFHIQQEDIIGKTLHDIFPKDIADEMKRNDKAVLEAGHALESEEIVLQDDGLHTYFSIKFPLLNDKGEVYAVCGISTDITERKQAEEELLKLSRAVEYSSSIVMITSLEGNIEYVNPKFTEITGYTKEHVLGKNPRLLKSGDTPKELYTDLWETILSGGEWKGEFRNRKKDGSLYRVRSSISGVKDAKGVITHFIAIEDDVTHEYELTEQLGYQASHDHLTGLINRREFERRLERLLATVLHDKDEHAFCYLDLDQFKLVNDTCGHIAGDELLRQLSSVLMETVRKRDTLARLGGDEFGVLMEHCSLDDAYRVADSLLKAIQNYQFVWEGHTFRVGVSIGLVAVNEITANLTELLKDADASCYMAKELGRNRIHVYHAEDSEITVRHGEMQWVARINQALEENRFCFYAQIIVPLDGSTDKHYELLLRMIDEKGNIIPPGAFLPAAERYNLMEKLDSWVIEKAFDLLAANPAFLEQIHFISINLSGQSLTKQDFLNFIVSKLKDSGILGDKICFEITETAAISNLSMADKFIATLKRFGCLFALDDFGSGLSSFAYLKNLSVDYLKIDGMFVKDIVDDPIDHAMVKSINEIGQVMEMKTIAEFVENDEIMDMLKEIGVNYAQGYGLGKPQPFDELLEQLTNVSI